jgi:hypothetical protein
LGAVQDVNHFVRVVLVHLAAEGFDEDFWVHGANTFILEVLSPDSKGWP